MPIDSGALILSVEEYNDFLQSEPNADKFVRNYIGGDELINGTKRYCLWLQDIASGELWKSKFVTTRVNLCREFREKSNRPQTKALADTPHLFGEIRQPNTDMLVVPKVSSENRRYIPIAFVTSNAIVNGSALIIPGASLYHFGVLTSNIHSAWMRAVCGRMKSDYQYSGGIVYNNFPWCLSAEAQKQTIEAAAEGILAAREKHQENTLADLYDPNFMPKDLLMAHRNLDKAVMLAYGFKPGATDEAACVAGLMEMYRAMTEGARI
jgi:hypothetical protein